MIRYIVAKTAFRFEDLVPVAISVNLLEPCLYLSMTPFFMLLPPEVRNEIYGHLFEQEYGVRLHSNGNKVEWELRIGVIRIEIQTWEGFREPAVYDDHAYICCPGILQTCPQIHQESRAIFYAKTTFRYTEQSTNTFDRTFSYSTRNLQFIQKLEILVKRRHDLESAIFMNRIVDLIHRTCALRRLDLSFELSRDEFPEDYSEKAWKRVLAHSRPALKALKVSVLLQYVRVIDWSGGYFGRTKWKPLAQALAESQGWGCDEQYRLQDRLFEDGARINLFARVWHVYPAGTTSTTQGMAGLVSDCKRSNKGSLAFERL